MLITVLKKMGNIVGPNLGTSNKHQMPWIKTRGGHSHGVAKGILVAENSDGKYDSSVLSVMLKYNVTLLTVVDW